MRLPYGSTSATPFGPKPWSEVRLEGLRDVEPVTAHQAASLNRCVRACVCVCVCAWEHFAASLNR